MSAKFKRTKPVKVGNALFDVYFKSSTGEFVVRTRINNKRVEDRCYYTDDVDDAFRTLAELIREEEENQRGRPSSNGQYVYVKARYNSSHRIHAFGSGDRSLCGLVHINDCFNLSEINISKRLKLYLWPKPKKDLNYCGRCRTSLNAKGVIE